MCYNIHIVPDTTYTDKKLITQGLRATATINERIEALCEAGFPASELARVAGVSPDGIRHWRTQIRKPNPLSVERIDNLRYAMSQLITKGLDPERAATWMQSSADTPPHDRPIDTLVDDPDAVLDTIATEIPTIKTSSE